MTEFPSLRRLNVSYTLVHVVYWAMFAIFAGYQTSLLLGRGFDIPVDITMLSSSRVDFKNDLISAGINQTKHQMKLDVVIDIDVIMPWRTVSKQVVSEILIAETVIVGKVPQT